MQHWISSTHSQHRRPRRNPDGGLAREAGMALVTTLVGVGIGVGLEKVVNGMTKEGTVPSDAPAGSKLALYTNNQVSGIVGGVGLALGVALHVKDVAPNIGKAVMASTVALAASRFLAHKDDAEAVRAARLAHSRGGIEVAPVMVSNGAGYLPSGAAVGAQYGIMNSGAAVGAQYGTISRG